MSPYIQGTNYLKEFFAAIGGKLFLLPGVVSGAVTLIGILEGLGVSNLPDISYWAIALFAVLPIAGWANGGLLGRVVKLQEQLGAYESQAADCPIRELFFHIDPKLLDESNDKAWEAVGSDGLDKLSMGQMRAWGREDGGPPQLVQITVGFWNRAAWTYWFLRSDPGSRGSIHAQLPPNIHAYPYQGYRDTHVNKVEALSPCRDRGLFGGPVPELESG